MLPPDDLKLFLAASNIPLQNIRNILSIGCGRAIRDLIALTELPELNRPSLSYTGIEISKLAVDAANAWAELLRQRDDLSSDSKCPVEGAQIGPLPPIQSHCQFINEDILGYLQLNHRYDLVIDWMCLHNIDKNIVDRYITLMKAACTKFLVVKVFSLEGSTVQDLGFMGGEVKKNQFSEQDVIRIFSPEFQLEGVEQYPEDLEPDPMPEDKIVAAKRAYLFRRTEFADFS
jgi:hypothetical protein